MKIRLLFMLPLNMPLEIIFLLGFKPMYILIDRPGDAYRTSFPTALRASYHFGKHFVKDKRLDLYGGAALGILSANHYDRWPDRHPKHLVGGDGGPNLGLYAGAKYLFSPRFGLFAEAGHNISWLKLGVAFRF